MRSHAGSRTGVYFLSEVESTRSSETPGLSLCYPTNLILQMKERREPIHMRMDDCCPSFFTVPVFRSRMRPEGEREAQQCEPLLRLGLGRKGQSAPNLGHARTSQANFLASPVFFGRNSEKWNPCGSQDLVFLSAISTCQLYCWMPVPQVTLVCPPPPPAHENSLCQDHRQLPHC